MSEYFGNIWGSLPQWIWLKFLTISGLIILFVSLNSLAKSSLKNRKK
tara:strand:- start:386 stop:526 length:141 start_codon:yes stop_codon:yes gene_type:complete